MLIKSDTRTHLSSKEAIKQLDMCWGYTVISDACAITIASWYASPSGNGTVFTELSTTGQCDNIELLQAIMYERKHANYDAHKAFDCLGTWVVTTTRTQRSGWLAL